MFILNVNCKANLFDILSDIPSGINRDYIVDANNTSRLYQQVFYSSKLVDRNITPYIEVKFASKYGKREKRIEIVGKGENEITIYKISTFAKFDKDALELASIISEIQEQFSELSLCGILLFLDNKTDIDFVINSLKSITDNITADYF